jgi:hypothetical protein
MDIKANLDHYITWFKAHERLVLLLAAGFFAVHFYGKGLDFLIKHDQTQRDIAVQQAQIAANKVTVDDTANKLVLAQLQTLQQQVAATQVRLDQAMRDRATQTTNQKKTDDQSNSSELAARIHTLLGVGTIQVETQSSPLPDRLVYSLDAAHADANSLEDLQQVRGDVKDLDTQLEGCKAVTTKQQDAIDGLNTQIADSKVALTKEQTAHVDDVKLLKAEKKKSWLNGFKWGVITGIVGSVFVHKP